MVGDGSKRPTGWTLCLDIGGTKSELLLAHSRRREGIHVVGQGANPVVYGSNGLNRVVALIRRGLEKAHLNPNDVRACTVGMAGISHPKYGSSLGKELSSLLPRVRLILISDAELAHWSLWGSEPGITLLAGTGSIAIGKDKEGHVRRAGGFGFQSGDEGGGYWLGKSVVMELIAAERSGARQAAELKKRILNHSGESDFEQLLTILSSGAEGVLKVAGLGPVVLEEAVKGNMIASHAVALGAEALARIVREVCVKLGLDQGEITVGASGSLLQESEFYRTRIRDELLMDFEAVHWLRSEYPPVYGGLICSGIEVSPLEFSSLEIQDV